ncbi:SapC family protein [Novosphingobium sp. FKTRR1]|uniref:SapC family protein n=1 Tax=Novosphingobium sp. FKTRR1 TaxID=2879118 RepID=UPI001CF06DB1|nr:SapC family protein [Novosphingobium sp. FKTRR1]
MNLVQLTRHDHAGLRIDPVRAAAAAATVHMVPLVLGEIRKLAPHFPIVLAKDGETGQFYPAALLGLEPHENLFWTGETFDAAQVPLNLLRLPFFIGDGAICIDADSPAITPDGPCAIVESDGSDSAYLRSIQAILSDLAGQQEATRRFVDALVARRLVVELTLDVAFANGAKAKLSGLYGIDEQALARDPAIMADFGDVLTPAAMVFSLDHIASLVRRKNTRLAAEAQWFGKPA